MTPRSLAALFVVVAACGKASPAPELCAPWNGLGLPAPTRVYDCSPTYVSMSLSDALTSDDAILAAMVDALRGSGFREVVTHARTKDDTSAVVRRDRDRMQLAVKVAGGSVDVRPDQAPALPGSLEDARREVAALRASFAPLAAAFPASLGRPRACDDAQLQRLDPELAAHPIRFVDVDALSTPSRSKAHGSLPKIPDAAPGVSPATTDEIGDLIRLQPQLPALRDQRVVIGYRVTVLDDPRDNGDAVAVKEEGQTVQQGTFAPGRFAADLVVFDRAGARPLCWTTVTATSSDVVSQGPHEHGAIWADFYDQVAAAVRGGVPVLSKVLRVAP